jgi:hypothetical protein
MKDLDKSVSEILEEFFIGLGIKYTKGVDAHFLMARYFNFRIKYIENHAREIRISKELERKIPNHINREALYDIFLKIVQGNDINPYQSKASFDSDFNDGLFNDWGIHHLHLNSFKKNQTDYFNIRTELLVFVRFKENTAYFLDIKSHKDNNVWSDKDLIRIIQQNWSETIAENEVHDVEFLDELNNEEIGLLRKSGCTSGLNVDGKSYLLLGYGQATSGINIMAMMTANNVWRWIGENKLLFMNDIQEFKAKLKEQLGI